jgi:hypothetical protein
LVYSFIGFRFPSDLACLDPSGRKSRWKSVWDGNFKIDISFTELLNKVWVYKAEVDDCKSKKCIVKSKNENISTFIGGTFFNSIN